MPNDLETHGNGTYSVSDDSTQANGDSYDQRFARLERQLTAHGHILETHQPGLPVSGVHRKLALPIPLAAYSIGSTCWVLGLLLLNTRHTTVPNGWLLTGLPMGVFMTFLAGIGEVFCGNTFGAALVVTTAGILTGLACMFLPWASIGPSVQAALGEDAARTPEIVNAATGTYLLVTMGAMAIIMIGSQRTAVAVVSSLGWVNILHIVFGAGLITGKMKLVTAAGGFFMVVAFNLFWNATAMLLLELDHPFARFMPMGALGPKD